MRVSSYRHRARILVAGSAAVLAATLGVTPALAVATWTVRPGGAIAAKSGTAAIEDTRTGAFKCKSLSASGTLKSGSGLSGAGAGAISAVGFHTCTSPLGLAQARRVGLVFTLRATNLPWHVTLSSYNRGVVTGTISHIEIHATTSACIWVIDGTSATASDGVIRFSYTNSTGKLALLTTGGNLHAYHVQGCFGEISNGDPFAVRAAFALSPKQAITGP